MSVAVFVIWLLRFRTSSTRCAAVVAGVPSGTVRDGDGLLKPDAKDYELTASGPRAARLSPRFCWESGRVSSAMSAKPRERSRAVLSVPLRHLSIHEVDAGVGADF